MFEPCVEGTVSGWGRYAAAMDEERVTGDELLARRYFDQWILPGLDGLPEDGITHLRERYVLDALADPEAVRQLREVYG